LLVSAVRAKVSLSFNFDFSVCPNFNTHFTPSRDHDFNFNFQLIPRHPSTNTGNRENISENARPALHTDATFSPKGKKKPAGFNLRKSIAWNPAFFTEEGSTIIVLFATSTTPQFGKLLAE
jgi:hypothetical protein